MANIQQNIYLHFPFTFARLIVWKIVCKKYNNEANGINKVWRYQYSSVKSWKFGPSAYGAWPDDPRQFVNTTGIYNI